MGPLFHPYEVPFFIDKKNVELIYKNTFMKN